MILLVCETRPEAMGRVAQGHDQQSCLLQRALFRSIVDGVFAKKWTFHHVRPLFLSLFFVLIANTPTIFVPVAVQTKGVDCLWEQSVCGALVCTTNHWFAIRIIGEVVWVLDSLHCGPRRLGIRDDAALAQFFDEYKFVFLVYASSIGHDHPEDQWARSEVVPKPEIVKIEPKSAKGADVLSVSSDSAEDVHPHQQSGPKTSDVHSPQCIGKTKAFLIWKVNITFLVRETTR